MIQFLKVLDNSHSLGKVEDKPPFGEVFPCKALCIGRLICVAFLTAPCLKITVVYRLSHDCSFDIDRDVSTAHCRSSSGDGVDLVSPQYGLFLPPWLLVTGVSTT